MPDLGDWRSNDAGGTLNGGQPSVSVAAQDAQWSLSLVVDPQQGSALDPEQQALLEDSLLRVGYQVWEPITPRNAMRDKERWRRGQLPK